MNIDQKDFQPIFVVGNSRSGTTLMTKILNRNSGVHAFGELHYFERLWDGDRQEILPAQTTRELCARLLHTAREGLFSKEPWIKYLDDADKLLHGSADDTMKGFDVYRTVLDAECKVNGQTRPCEQTPYYIFFLPDILTEYIGARVLIMVRDPRAILLSQKMKWKGKTSGPKKTQLSILERLRRWANYHPILTSKLWNTTIKAGENVADDSHVMTVRFEELVMRPSQTVQNVCKFLELDYSESMLEVASSLSPTAGNNNSKDDGIDAAVADRWRKELAAIDLYWCERINGTQMKRFGYELSGMRPSWFMIALSFVSLPFKSGLAVVLNMDKILHIVTFMRRRFA